ncbi:type II toxin-antitoxin system prevent-host-death family antitoxin (plasmid) [Skermanella sp. TT6]|uniref:Type II toxin-antitoxin system prevent-host-death family antitoxin n=1 Tax=Skermanella cutis TaxID=2775420 RepID=A0ABX7BIZ7_9PROT|nr:type II toxin-antitoxin system prevent-host-death family antitoxin [Skermanella sp. TT6]QQP93061.1 type II toxin-antitoxin system prevent-host-death family antitoxin [Skermanella sp. TT6]
MTAHAYIVDAESLPARSSTEVQDKWGTVAREVRAKGRIAVTSRGHADMVIMSREEYDRVMQALSVPGAAAEDPVADLTRRFDERIARMKDGTMADKIKRLRAMTGQVPNPPIAGESF